MADYRIRRATLRDLPDVLDLIDEAASWLQGKGTDQWAKPWPNRHARDQRVRKGVEEGKTWIVDLDSEKAIATITVDQVGNPRLWEPEFLREPALYVQRLVVGRGFEHRGLGALLMDWAGLRALEEWNATYIRIDVWTSNHALHHYYKSTGFAHVGTRDDLKYPVGLFRWRRYPAGFLMQKRTNEIPRRPLPFVVEEVAHEEEPAPLVGRRSIWGNIRTPSIQGR